MARHRQSEVAPMLQSMDPVPVGKRASETHMEDTPAYAILSRANMLESKYRKKTFDDIFEKDDLRANSSNDNNMKQRCLYGYYCLPGIGCCLYKATHMELFVPAGHVGLLLDEQNNYILAEPGMHNINSIFTKHVGTQSLHSNKQVMHGNRTILVVEQGYVGLANDNGQPVLLPPGIHVWTSDTLRYDSQASLDQHNVKLGPYTLVTVDEGYVAVTQNNGKQHILEGGKSHLLDHKNWCFQKMMSLKIQTDDLEQIIATTADNITMQLTSTVTWRVVDAKLAATMAESSKLRTDVLKQAIASLASFIGGVNYSDSFHVASEAQASQSSGPRRSKSAQTHGKNTSEDNPMYDEARMSSSVDHANLTTKTYGVEITSINILSAIPNDRVLTRALASGAVASAEALQAETAARGNAKATRIAAEAAAQKSQIDAEGECRAEIIRAKAQGDAVRFVAEGNLKAANLLATSRVAVDLAKIDKSASLIGPNDKFFFGQEPAYLGGLLMKDGIPCQKDAKRAMFG